MSKGYKFQKNGGPNYEVKHLISYVRGELSFHETICLEKRMKEDGNLNTLVNAIRIALPELEKDNMTAEERLERSKQECKNRFYLEVSRLKSYEKRKRNFIKTIIIIVLCIIAFAIPKWFSEENPQKIPVYPSEIFSNKPTCENRPLNYPQRVLKSINTASMTVLINNSGTFLNTKYCCRLNHTGFISSNLKTTYNFNHLQKSFSETMPARQKQTKIVWIIDYQLTRSTLAPVQSDWLSKAKSLLNIMQDATDVSSNNFVQNENYRIDFKKSNNYSVLNGETMYYLRSIDHVYNQKEIELDNTESSLSHNYLSLR